MLFRSDDVTAQLNIWGAEGWRAINFKAKGMYNYILLERPYGKYREFGWDAYGDFESVASAPGDPISAPVEQK